MNLIIETPSRLHVTLMDMNGIYGRIDGGVGITTRSPSLMVEAHSGYDDVEVEFQDKDLPTDVQGDYRAKILSVTRKVNEHFDLEDGYHFNLKEVFPSHSGLGSGTQLSLAAARLILELNDLEITTRKLAEIVGRGGTSGIGVESFRRGGFIVDCGHKLTDKRDFLPSSTSKAPPAPIIARYDFPRDWRIIMAIPRVEKKVYGDGEVDIFQEYCPIPLEEVRELTHLLFMKMMPSVLEEDLDSFGEAVNTIQGLGFKRVELELQTPFITELLDDLRSAGAAGVGMSSFGPTVYAVTDTGAKDIYRAARDSMKDNDGEIILTGGQNKGAQIFK